MSVSKEIKSRLSSYLSQLGSSSNGDRQLISDILNAAVEDFATITHPSPHHALVMRKCYASKLRVAAGDSGAELVHSSAEFLLRDSEIAKRVKILLYFLSCFEPAMYRSIKSHYQNQGASKVDFIAKMTGRQAGTVAEVYGKDGCLSTVHFIKSTHPFHENGRDFEHVATDKVEFLDYKELFVFCVLEKLGLGPKVEFIVAPDVTALPTGDKSSVLISSQDHSTGDFDLLLIESRYGQRRDFTQPTGNRHCGVGDQAVWFRSLTEILAVETEKLRASGTECPLEIARHLDAVTEQLFSTPTAQRDLKTIDLLCRALHLGDVLVNDSNFGRVTNAASGEEVGWRVVDFQIVHDSKLHGDGAHYCVLTLGTEYPEVKGRLKYRGFTALRKMLLEANSLGREVKERILKTRNFKKALETAREEIESFLIANKEVLCIEEGMHKRKMVDLSAYIDAAWENVDLA